MKHNFALLLSCLWFMSLQAQPEKVVGITWSDGASAYSCKWLSDSLIEFYGTRYHSEDRTTDVQVEPDGRLTIGKMGDSIVYKEIGDHEYLIFYRKGHVRDAWEALRKNESLEQFISRYKALYGLAGVYLDSVTHRKIVFRSDTLIVTGLANATKRQKFRWIR